MKVDVAPGVPTGRIYESEHLPPDDLWSLAQSDIEFMFVDMRLSMSPPLLGFYFDPWDRNDGTPLSPQALLKFDAIDGVGRIYDNGWIKIFDLRGMHGHS